MGFGIIRDMGTELKPTLWRTARALANPDRLNLMRLVANAKGAKGVVDLANEANLWGQALSNACKIRGF